ncbi:MAG: electron transfer flavoprotein subunit alpha/FixB family protein [Gammaproteobacteria bacterium]|jgi:electron transfer flavoprotein alpha subunit|nr:electron transfer flavoprotein subunit alpha/FixB family protein [Gammaproteobacteria bacterium]MDP6616658.1 electron transfer flavoprotein subunit alpha/FixB family protein [Gammaproteobacteria bacterium]MDP6694988.1 electron transfer flavoprotein subunit alpha/FixB family protein [Gammaproteobacteria bacterium]
MSKVLIIAELNGSALNPSTAKCVACAQAVSPDSIDIAVFSHQCADAAATAAGITGVSRVLCIESEANRHPLAAVLAPQAAELAADYDYVFGPSTTFGKDVMPRIAALLGVGQVSDIMSVASPRSFARPVYAGNAVLTVEVPEGKTIVATVRTASWKDAPTGGSASVENASVTAEIPAHTRFVELASEASERPDLQTAKKVISGGRGVGSSENFDLIYQLATKLGAGVGASRAAVDAGYVANDMQVGQTGKIIAPELYIAFGISGAIQHLTGIKDAGTIVAVNKDPEAPIFEIADIGLVGDLFEVLPELEQKL